MFRGMWLLLGFGLPSCFNMAAASTGQLGCSEDQITVSDDATNEGSRTWVAECRGKRFFCTASTGVHCQEELADSARPGVHVSDAAKTPPSGAAGFVFGSAPEQAADACTSSAHEWMPGAKDRYTCSGTPSPVGFPAVATLGFCGNKLCAVALQVDASANWLSGYAKLSEALTQKYGDPAQTLGELGSGCQTEPEFDDCVMTDGLKLGRQWRWNAWNRVSLDVSAGAKSPRLDLVYIQKIDSPAAL